MLEILIVISIFAFLATMATRSVLLTMRGSRKSEAVTKVRENLAYALAVMERNLRNAESLDCTSSTTETVYYQDENGDTVSFACVGLTGSDSYIASDSGRLTSDEIEITSCNFVCDDATSPPSVTISVEAQSKAAQGIEGAKVSSSTRIFLRNY